MSRRLQDGRTAQARTRARHRRVLALVAEIRAYVTQAHDDLLDSSATMRSAIVGLTDAITGMAVRHVVDAFVQQNLPRLVAGIVVPESEPFHVTLNRHPRGIRL